MPQKIEAIVGKRVLYHRFYGVISIEDLRKGNEDALALVQQADGPVYDVIDTTDMQGFSFNLLEAEKATSVFKEPNFGWAMIIGGNPLMRFFASVLTKMVNKNTRFFASLDEAYSLIEHIEPELAASLPPIETLKAKKHSSEP